MAGVKHEFYKFLYNRINISPVRIPRAFELLNRIYCRIINFKNESESKSHAIFTKAVEAILQHYREADFNVESLAELLGVSTVHLRRVFSHYVDKSPIKYINDMRFEQAKVLLKSANLTVGEIALSLEFGDRFYFSKSFKEAVGIPATDYRALPVLF